MAEAPSIINRTDKRLFLVKVWYDRRGGRFTLANAEPDPSRPAKTEFEIEAGGSLPISRKPAAVQISGNFPRERTFVDSRGRLKKETVGVTETELFVLDPNFNLATGADRQHNVLGLKEGSLVVTRNYNPLTRRKWDLSNTSRKAGCAVREYLSPDMKVRELKATEAYRTLKEREGHKGEDGKHLRKGDLYLALLMITKETRRHSSPGKSPRKKVSSRSPKKSPKRSSRKRRSLG